MPKVHEHRPLSPHLGIYRWQITNTLSILHRLTGVALTLGLVPLALWLYGAAYSPALFTCMNDIFASILGKLALFGWTVAFYYHLGNGMRHLNWDIGRGFSLTEVTSSGQVVIAFAICMSIFSWALASAKAGIL